MSTNVHRIPARVMKTLFARTAKDLTVVRVNRDSLEMERLAKV